MPRAAGAGLRMGLRIQGHACGQDCGRQLYQKPSAGLAKGRIFAGHIRGSEQSSKRCFGPKVPRLVHLFADQLKQSGSCCALGRVLTVEHKAATAFVRHR
jgi:hypothetical protein